jgi:uncharacterized protein YbjT (DUF2867 family)
MTWEGGTVEEPTILVTGAAGGQQGSTGYHVTRLLLERGQHVRAFVHRLDERSDNLRALGAEVVEGDLLNLGSVSAAMSGVKRSYFAYPVQDGLLDATATFAAAAREAGSELVVNLSQLLNRSGEHRTPHQKRHWLSEQVFDWADVGAVHLDATIFYENLRALTQRSLATTGTIALPWGPDTTTIAMVSAEDVARVAVGVLTGPVMPNGTVLPLIGNVVTIKEIVDAFSDILGRQVQYREISGDEWAQSVSGAGINDTAVEHLSHLWRYLRTSTPEQQASYRVSDSIKRIGGAEPTSLQRFLREQKDAFSGALRPSP